MDAFLRVGNEFACDLKHKQVIMLTAQIIPKLPQSVLNKNVFLCHAVEVPIPEVINLTKLACTCGSDVAFAALGPPVTFHMGVV